MDASKKFNKHSLKRDLKKLAENKKKIIVQGEWKSRIFIPPPRNLWVSRDLESLLQAMIQGYSSRFIRSKTT